MYRIDLMTNLDYSRVDIDIEDEQYVPSRGWAEMIKKVYEVDPLICPSRQGDNFLVVFHVFENSGPSREVYVDFGLVTTVA